VNDNIVFICTIAVKLEGEKPHLTRLAVWRGRKVCIFEAVRILDGDPDRIAPAASAFEIYLLKVVRVLGETVPPHDVMHGVDDVEGIHDRAVDAIIFVHELIRRGLRGRSGTLVRKGVVALCRGSNGIGRGLLPLIRRGNASVNPFGVYEGLKALRGILFLNRENSVLPKRPRVRANPKASCMMGSPCSSQHNRRTR
jgi:hypothetical protein